MFLLYDNNASDAGNYEVGVGVRVESGVPLQIVVLPRGTGHIS